MSLQNHIVSMPWEFLTSSSIKYVVEILPVNLVSINDIQLMDIM